MSAPERKVEEFAECSPINKGNSMKLTKMLLIVAFACIPFFGFGKSKNVSLYYGDGEVLEPEDSVTFMVDDLPDEIGGYEVLTEYFPDGISCEWTGKKLKAPKAGKVKYSKKEEDFVATSDENPCGFKVSINKKKGTVKGSFKVYCAKSEKKLKSYRASFSGTLGGIIYITIKKVGSFTATFE